MTECLNDAETERDKQGHCLSLNCESALSRISEHALSIKWYFRHDDDEYCATYSAYKFSIMKPSIMYCIIAVHTFNDKGAFEVVWKWDIHWTREITIIQTCLKCRWLHNSLKHTWQKFLSKFQNCTICYLQAAKVSLSMYSGNMSQ